MRALTPDRAATMKLDMPGIIVTGAGDAPYDFTSRFFAPADGIFEDPVTGSAHAALSPTGATCSARPTSWHTRHLRVAAS